MGAVRAPVCLVEANGRKPHISSAKLADEDGLLPDGASSVRDPEQRTVLVQTLEFKQFQAKVFVFWCPVHEIFG